MFGLRSWVGVVGAMVAVGATAGEAAALGFERRVVDGRFSSGGEVVLDERRRLLLTADRDATSGDATPPGVSVVDVDRLVHCRTIAFWTQPWTSVVGPDGAATPHPQVPSGIDSDARRGLVVTANSQTDTVTIAPVGTRAATARDLVAVGDHPFGVAVDERAGLAYVALYGSGRIDVIDVRSRRVVRSIEGLTAPTKLALSADGHRLYVGNADRAGDAHAVTVVDPRSGTITARIPVDPNSRPTLDEATGLLYAASFETGRIAVVDLETQTVRRWVATGSTPHGVAVDARNDLLYLPNLLGNSVKVLDRRTLEPIAVEPVAGVPLGVAVDDRTGWAAISSRDASTLTLLRPKRR